MAMTRSIPLRTSCLYYRAALFVPPPPPPPPFIPFDKTACGFQEGYMKLLQVHRQSPASLYLRLNSPSPPPLSRRCCTMFPLSIRTWPRQIFFVVCPPRSETRLEIELSTIEEGREKKWRRKHDGIGRETLANLPSIIYFHLSFAVRVIYIARRDVIQIHRIEEGELKLSRTRVTGGFKTPFKREVSQGADKNFIMEIQRAKFISYFAKKEI